jgi:hypothetical protein
MLNFDTLFKDHVATREDHGPLSVITYQKPNDGQYGLRFIFDNDWSTLTITGDSLNAIFTNCNNMGSPDRLYQTSFMPGKHVCSYGHYELSYDIGYLANKRRTKIPYDEPGDLTYDDIKSHIEATLDIAIGDYDGSLNDDLNDAFEALIETLGVYIQLSGTIPEDAESLCSTISSSLNRDAYNLIEDYLDENHPDVTVEGLIDVPLPVNESLVFVFEGFKRAYEALERQTTCQL